MIFKLDVSDVYFCWKKKNRVLNTIKTLENLGFTGIYENNCDSCDPFSYYHIDKQRPIITLNSLEELIEFKNIIGQSLILESIDESSLVLKICNDCLEE